MTQSSPRSLSVISLIGTAHPQVWDVITDQESVDIIKDITSPQEACELLMKKSLEKGTTDNLTVMVIRFQQEFVEKPVEKEEVQEKEDPSLAPEEA